MQSSPVPVSVKMSPSNPEVWVSSWRTVICAAASSSAIRNSGRYVRTGSSRPTFPSSTSCMTSVLVHSLVIEPIWNTESAVASTPVPLCSNPAAPSTISSPWRTPQAAPGTSYFSSSCGTVSSSHACTSLSLLMSGHGRNQGDRHVGRTRQLMTGRFVAADEARRQTCRRRCLAGSSWRMLRKAKTSVLNPTHVARAMYQSVSRIQVGSRIPQAVSSQRLSHGISRPGAAARGT